MQQIASQESSGIDTNAAHHLDSCRAQIPEIVRRVILDADLRRSQPDWATPWRNWLPRLNGSQP
jgi:hypothetical protein